MELKEEQFAVLKEQFKTLKDRSPFYAKKFEGIDLSDVQTQADFEALPFSEKADLRDAYPLGLAAVPESEIVRIHSSSGTTGTPVIIPYTQQDVLDWAVQFARCYEMAGITKDDRIQITPGYGLWTAGIGFQLGAERLGAMAVPMGPGNTDKQIRFMKDMQSTVLCATSSYALLLAEEIAKRGVRDELNLKRAVIGSERWGHKTVSYTHLGWLAGNFGFRSVFVVMAAVAALAVVLVFALTQESTAEETPKMDWAGVVTLGIAFLAIYLAIDEVGALAAANWGLVAILVVIAVVFFVIFWKMCIRDRSIFPQGTKRESSRRSIRVRRSSCVKIRPNERCRKRSHPISI